MLGAACGGLLTVGVMKAAGFDGSLVAVIGIACAGPEIAGAWSFLNRWSASRAARELDARLGLKDRLSSGLELAGLAGLDGFAALAVVDAERAAATVDVRLAIPVRFGRSWRVWPFVLTAAVAAAVYVPQARWAERAKTERADAREERLSAAEQIASASAALETVSRRDAAAASAEELAALADLRQELAKGSAQAGESLTRAAEAVGDASDRMEKQAKARRALLDEDRERLARAVQGAPAADDPAGLAKALSKGDAAGAAEVVKELRERADSMPREERERVARQLEEMARTLDEMKRQEAKGEAESKEQPTPNQNVPGAEQSQGEKSAEQKPSPPSGDASKPEIQQSKPRASGERSQEPKQDENSAQGEKRDPSGDQPGTKQGEERNDQNRSGEQKPGQEKQPRSEGEKEQLNRLSDAMRDAARDLRNEKQARGEKQPRRDGQQGEQQQRPDGAQGEEPGAERRPGDMSKPPQPGEQRERSSRQQPLGEKQQPEQQGRQQEGNADQGRQPRPEPGAGEQSPQGSGRQSTPGNQQTPDVKPGPNSQGPDGEKAPVPRGAQNDQGKPGANQQHQQNQQPGAGQSQERSPSPGSPTGLDRLERELQKMADDGRSIDRRLADSQRLREQAERMLSQATPEQRKRLEELAERLGGGGGAERGPRGPVTAPTARPSLESEATTPVDARPMPTPGAEGETIAQWLGEGGRGNAEPRRLAEGLRRAADGAERSVEQQRVPARHSDLVRRVFQRYMERAAELRKSTGGTPVPPVPRTTPDAPDAARGTP